MNRSLALLLALVFPLSLFATNPLVTLQPIASGLDSPVSITHAGDSRLFITQQRGQVVIWDGTRILPTPFLDIRSIISNGGERGLLSIAFHPQYAENGFFFVNYTNLGGHTIIARYRVSADPNRADPTSAVQLLLIEQPFANHNGGQVQFGPDGYLYIGMGDGGSGGDPGNRAQSLATLLGKMLRIDVNGNPYSVPPSNPFVNNTAARPEIWSLGLRNPWRFSFDRASGDLWIADVGQGEWEEVDVQPATSIGGENYGWRRMEGTHCFNPSSNCDTGNLVLPVLEYNHSSGACSVTGGYVYRGAALPRLQGMYIYGDYCNGKIWGASRTGSQPVVIRELLDTTLSISSFGEDVNGELYVADHSGAVYRMDDARPLNPKRRAVRR
ncbi:MAG TPA: PQQ-dependent sugar dehydrogenase [Thermoanaerobaculia bacterium]|jgi:glucose/arabinose dehydrogenase|nr:PQQ-dependent sugar dehydrogenase [Thermoanaerobaculia bacterium]